MPDSNTPDPNANPNPGSQPNSDPGQGGGGGDWRTGISDDLRSHVEGFQTASDFVKAHADLKGKIPSLPDKPDAYKIEFDGVEIPKDQQEKATKQYEVWRAWAHKNGLTQAQFKQLISEDARMRIGTMTKAQADFDKSVKTLKDDWKNEYDANLTKADEAVSLLFDEEFRGYLKESGLGNNPKFVKGMFALSKKISEDTLTRTQNKPKGGPKIDPVTGQKMLRYDKSPGMQ